MPVASFPWRKTPTTPDCFGWNRTYAACFLSTRSTFPAASRAPYAGAHSTFAWTRAFAAVVANCAEATADRPVTWINRRIRELYVELHRMGHCHSVETWQDGHLVGGLYGVRLGRSVLRRKHVFPRDRCLKGSAGASREPTERRRVRPARHAVHDHTPGAVRYRGDTQTPLPETCWRPRWGPMRTSTRSTLTVTTSSCRMPVAAVARRTFACIPSTTRR